MMDFEQQAALMQKLEPLCEELQPYLLDMGRFKGVNHPLVQEIPLFDVNRCALLNLRLRCKQEAVAKAQAAKEWERLIYLHERPYRFDALHNITLAHTLTDEELAPLVASVWVDSENIWQHQQAWLEVWRTLKCPQLTMDDSERLILDRTKIEHITIYRGVQARNMNRMGMSWTLDRKKAEWFAKRYASANPRVLSGSITRDKIFAHFVGRGESEIVVDPQFVTNVKDSPA